MDCRSRYIYLVQRLAASPLRPLISSSPPSEPCVPRIHPSSAFRGLISEVMLRYIVTHLLLFSRLSSSSPLRPLLLSRLRWRRFESSSSPRLSSRRVDDWWSRDQS